MIKQSENSRLRNNGARTSLTIYLLIRDNKTSLLGKRKLKYLFRGKMRPANVVDFRFKFKVAYKLKDHTRASFLPRNNLAKEVKRRVCGNFLCDFHKFYGRKSLPSFKPKVSKFT